MVEFVTKEPWYDRSPFTGDCWMTPTFMVKDGVEHFMFNQRDTDPQYVKDEDAARMKELKKNDGAYLTFCGGIYGGPFGPLKMAIRRRYTLWATGGRIVERNEKRGYVDFGGNFNEVSGAFSFRIYDKKLADTIEEAVALLRSEDYEGAQNLLERYEALK